MTVRQRRLPTGKWWFVVFALTQVAVMLLAISNESLWIDEFWTAHFGAMASFKAFYELVLVPSGSQTPLHFLHFYLWGLLAPSGEFFLRLANLPLFVAGQLAVYWALRNYPRKFAIIFLALSALHPMVWHYADEARPYIMMYAGSQMILAYLLNLHAGDTRSGNVPLLFSAIFVTGSLLLFGASLLGAFWVFAACTYAALFHYRYLNWRYLTRGANLLLFSGFLVFVAVMTIYYFHSVVNGARPSRLASTVAAPLAFAIYELLGLTGVGPGRLELRSTGPASLGQYWLPLLAMSAIVLATLFKGLQRATKLLGVRELIIIVAFALFPVMVVVTSAFVMHWRVLGRHLIATLPFLNMLFAIGLYHCLEPNNRPVRPIKFLVGVSFLGMLTISSFSIRFSERHAKDDYRTAARIAQDAISQGKSVWWVADAIGANYYKLPGEFDVVGELTGVHKPFSCIDRPGVQAVSNAPITCLRLLLPPDVVIFSKPDVFDESGDVSAYIKNGNFSVAKTIPGFTIWWSDKNRVQERR